MATDYVSDEFIETYEDSPTLESYDGGLDLDLDGNEFGTTTGGVIGGVDDDTRFAQPSGSGVDGRDCVTTGTNKAIHANNETSVGVDASSSKGGSDRNVHRSEGSGNRSGRNRGSSKEGGSKVSTPRKQSNATTPRKRSRESGEGGDGKATKSRKKGENSGNVREGGSTVVEPKSITIIGNGCGTCLQDIAHQHAGNESKGNAGDVLGGESHTGHVAGGAVVDRKDRYLVNLLEMQRDIEKRKGGNSSVGGKQVDLIALGEEIRKCGGVKCYSMDAFLMCNKSQLICSGVFVDQDGKVSVSTLECQWNFQTLLREDPNLDVTFTEDMKKRMNRKWWKVESKYHRRILEAQNNSVIGPNGEKQFTMNITGFYKGAMVDKETGKSLVTFNPVLVFLPYNVQVK